jgi:predicted dienelactone hydrolase
MTRTTGRLTYVYRVEPGLDGRFDAVRFVLPHGWGTYASVREILGSHNNARRALEHCHFSSQMLATRLAKRLRTARVIVQVPPGEQHQS